MRIILALLALLGLGLSAQQAWLWGRALEANTWPSTEGVITRSGNRLKTDFLPSPDQYDAAPRKAITEYSFVEYRYAVQGTEYASGRVSLGESGREHDRYHLNQEVEVFYDPQQPERALLETGVSVAMQRRLGFGLFLVVFSAVGWLWGGTILGWALGARAVEQLAGAKQRPVEPE